jgi:hypothetical protein
LPSACEDRIEETRPCCHHDASQVEPSWVHGSFRSREKERDLRGAYNSCPPGGNGS